MYVHFAHSLSWKNASSCRPLHPHGDRQIYRMCLSLLSLSRFSATFRRGGVESSLSELHECGVVNVVAVLSHIGRILGRVLGTGPETGAGRVCGNNANAQTKRRTTLLLFKLSIPPRSTPKLTCWLCWSKKNLFRVSYLWMRSILGFRQRPRQKKATPAFILRCFSYPLTGYLPIWRWQNWRLCGDKC